MRGIPRGVVARKMPVKGTNYTADQIANTNSTCGWLNLMYGLDMSKPGAQEYYNSLYDLYAEWGVDYVKVDDISTPYHKEEIEGVARLLINPAVRLYSACHRVMKLPESKLSMLRKMLTCGGYQLISGMIGMN